MGRLVLVLPAVHRSEERPGVRRSGEGKSVDAGRSLRRRRRARRAASALLALLAQGAVRSRPCQHAGAVPEAGQPGDDPGRGGVHRLPRRADGASRRRREARGRRRRQGDYVLRQPRRRTDETVNVARRSGREAGRGRSCSRPSTTIRIDSRAYKMSKSRGNVINPDDVVKEYGADSLAALRNVHGPARSDEAVEHGRRQRRARLSRSRLADDRRRSGRRRWRCNAAVQDVPPTDEQNRVLHQNDRSGDARHSSACRSTRRSPG